MAAQGVRLCDNVVLHALLLSRLSAYARSILMYIVVRSKRWCRSTTLRRKGTWKSRVSQRSYSAARATSPYSGAIAGLCRSHHEAVAQAMVRAAGFHFI